MTILKIKKLVPRATVPKYAHPGEDACFDLRVLIDDAENDPFIFNDGERTSIKDADRHCDGDGLTTGVWIRPGDSVILKTGIACELPPGFVMKIYARSSTGLKNHLMLSNGTGIIDAGYRGEIHIGLTNFGSKSVCIHDGDRIAQAEICRVEDVIIEECEELSSSVRGTGGIGSSGSR